MVLFFGSKTGDSPDVTSGRKVRTLTNFLNKIQLVAAPTPERVRSSDRESASEVTPVVREDRGASSDAQGES